MELPSLFAVGLTCLAAAAATTAFAQQPVSVTIDRTKPAGVSRLALGVTHTQHGLDTGGDPEVIARGKKLLARSVRYHNVHIMGWGTMNPNPAPGVYDWESLDRRMAMVRSIPGAVPVITLCAAPDWMKGGEPNTTDWSKIEVAPRPEHYQDFADLAATVARRYPDVKHFQVWNEMKGLWKPAIGNWDYENYTRLYNLCYGALKKVNPQINVGGLYLVIEGTGSHKNAGDAAASWATETPIRARQWDVIHYWLKNKRGADFLCLDRAIRTFQDKNTYTPAEQMALTPLFGKIARQIRQKTNLPIWWSEYYGGSRNGDGQYTAALHASILRHMLLAGSSVALLWNGSDTGEVSHALITDTRKPDGGRPLPLHTVFRIFAEDFGPGTRLVTATSSSPDVEALASATHTLLINKNNAETVVVVDGTRHTLAPYAIALLDFPGPPRRSDPSAP